MVPYTWVGVSISIASFLAALTLLQWLLALDYPKLQQRLLLALILFPTAFFFISVYSESIFLLWGVLAVYSARKKQWALASLAVALASVTRLVGILLLLPVVWEWYIQKGKKGYLVWFLASGLGIAGYAVYNAYRWGNPLYFVQAHALLANGRSVTAVVNPLQTLYRYIKILSTLPPIQYEWSVALLELGVAAWIIAMLVLLWKQRTRTSYVLYALVVTILPLLSGTWSGLPRYALMAFPLLIPLAQIRSRVLFYGLLTLSGILQIILAVLFARGYYVA